MILRRLSHIVAALAALSIPAAAAPLAGAAERTVVVVDAQDGWPTAAGQPSTPDLGRVEVRYDTAGTLALSAEFYADANALSTERAYAWSLHFALGRRSPVTPGACVPVVQGHAQIAAANGSSIANRLSIQGTDGYLTFAPVYEYPPAVAGTRLTFMAKSTSLADRDLRCVVLSVAAREPGFEDDPTASYDEPCGCWYVGAVDDRVPVAWFEGFAPDTATPTPPATTPAPKPKPKPDGRRPSSARISVGPSECAILAGLRSIAPGLGGGPWGAFVVRIDGPIHRTVRIPVGGRPVSGFIAIARIRHIPGGAYTVRSYYAGDARRRPSAPQTKSFIVHCM